MKKPLSFQFFLALSTACLFGQMAAAQPGSTPPPFRPDFSKPGRPDLMAASQFSSRNSRPDFSGKGPNSFLPPRVKTRPASQASSASAGTKSGGSPLPMIGIGLGVVAAGAAFALSKKPTKQ